ncbi:protein MIZU-KUSSEI 1 [Elaeis guineensis]|uniref:Protein MIZU-KUSSEI 1 n=1 Tax=Elaeis guineensis var. tenera TaxID=51953 RepID=A0A6I9R5J9_ELAGV|nr:protein MIZU-KUSSEI 1 [Elaeis guineensis]
MKVIDCLRRSLFSCLANRPSIKPKSKKVKASSTAAPGTSSSSATVKNRPSASFADLFKDRKEEAPQEEDSLIDAAERPPSSPSRSVIVGTIFGHRRGRVAFCVQHDPTVPPPFLFELSIPTQLLAREMRSGLLRVALECHRSGRRAWKAYCNGRKVGYAVRRRPTEKERRVLEMVRSMSAGAGVLFPGDGGAGAGAEELGELMYMRATYERVVGSRDSVSYHLINPGGSPAQELSIFLLRSG